MLSPRKICTIWKQLSTITILKISLWRARSQYFTVETDSSPSFYWHRDSDCELWGQIFPLKKKEKKRKPLIFVSWGMCKNEEWDLRDLCFLSSLSLFFPRLKENWSVKKYLKCNYIVVVEKLCPPALLQVHRIWWFWLLNVSLNFECLTRPLGHWLLQYRRTRCSSRLLTSKSSFGILTNVNWSV